MRISLALTALAGFIAATAIGSPLSARAQTPAPTPPGGTVPAANANETPSERDARMHWWREARFGMFIHWGLYAVPAGTYDGRQVAGIGEWIMNHGKIPVATYANYAAQFDPEKFNADDWVSVAKSAGMRYIVITSKHHDGFAMYHTKVDGYNIYDATPFKRDPIAELSAACKKAGIKFGVYYSQAQDWHAPGGAAVGGHWDPAAQDGSFDDYLKSKAIPQVQELLTNYHPAVLWFDTPIEMTAERAALFQPILASDPGLIWNNRLGGGYKGDTETPEQHIPATGYPGRDWETCMTINDTWGYKSYDTNFKSTETLLHNLIDIASKGGNYLLNVGPTSEGIIPQPEVDRIEAVGAWMKVNGDAIYATSASPYRRLPFDGRCTVKDKTLYLHVFTWPDGGLTLPGLQTEVRDARALATGQKLKVDKADDGTLTIAKPDTIDPLATVIELRLKGAPVVVEPLIAIRAQADGTFALAAADATVQGDTAKLEGENIGFWTNEKDTVSWPITVSAAQAGPYRVEIEYSAASDSGGATFAVQINGVPDATVTGTVQPTGDWKKYSKSKIDGTLSLTAGSATIHLVPLTKPGPAVMNVRRVTLIPAGR